MFWLSFGQLGGKGTAEAIPGAKGGMPSIGGGTSMGSGGGEGMLDDSCIGGAGGTELSFASSNGLSFSFSNTFSLLADFNVLSLASISTLACRASPSCLWSSLTLALSSWLDFSEMK